MVAAKQKKRGRINRSRAKFVVIGAEGKNKTEKIYFSQLFKQNSRYKPKFPTANETDPNGIVEATIRYIKNEEIDLADGDIAFCVVDTDTNPSKQAQIDKALRMAKNNGINLILSNPCFEIWFLQHFRYSTGGLTNQEAIEELETYLGKYEKNSSVYEAIAAKQEEAVKHAKKLEKYHNELGRSPQSMQCNPSTEVYKIVEIN